MAGFFPLIRKLGRTVQTAVGDAISLVGALNYAPSITVVSASTVDLGAIASNNVIISGAVSINSFGATGTEGMTRKLVFSGAMLLTYHAGILILPGNVNITTAVNDSAEFKCLGGGNWICIKYNYAVPTTSSLPEGTNKYWTLARVLTGALTGYVLGTDGSALTATDQLLFAFQKLQVQINTLAASSGIGYGQTWQVVTSSRAFGTTYTNTTGKPICISVLATLNSGAYSYLLASINGGGNFAFGAGSDSSGTTYMAGTLIIPVGATYAVSVSTGAFANSGWVELR